MAPPAFVSQTTKYHHQNAVHLAKAAQLAYELPETVHNTATGWGYSKVAFLEQRETQLFVAGNDDMIIVAFRGTEPTQLKDWLTDAQFRRKPGPFGKVHRGFLKALDRVWYDVENTLISFQDRAQSLWFTGHSLGAALATLAAARLAEEAKPVNGLYTFGQPRVGGRTFARDFDLVLQRRTFRFVNNNDLVTRVPLRKLGYRHCGQTLYFDAAGLLHDDIHWWNRFVEGVKGHAYDLGNIGPDGFRDHAMARYLQHLEKKKNQTRRILR